MSADPLSAPAVAPPGGDLLRKIVGWCADVCEANPHAVAHDGACGLRYACPRHGDDAYLRAEILRNGDLLLHCEGKRIRPGDLGYHDQLAGLSTRAGDDLAARRLADLRR